VPSTWCLGKRFTTVGWWVALIAPQKVDWDQCPDPLYGRDNGPILPPLHHASGPTKHAYIEPTAINHALIDMPLFLTPDRYIPVPLEETYLAAYHGVPRRWRVVLQDD